MAKLKEYLTEFRKHSFILGYLLLVTGMVLAISQMRHLQNEMEERNIARAIVVCEANNDVKGVMAGMLRQLFIIDADEFEELTEEMIVEREERISRLEATILAPVECDEVVAADEKELQ